MKYTPRGLRHRSGDSWEVTLSYTDPMTGKSKRHYTTVHARTEKQAQKKRDALIIELESKGAPATVKTTITEWLDEWLAFKKNGKSIEESTYMDYKKVAKNQIKPYLGDKKLGEITVDMLGDWMDTLLEEYDPTTVKKGFRILKQSLKHAESRSLINKNPCNFCTPPKCYSKDVNYLDREERMRMLALALSATNDSNIALAIVIALNTGLRREEVCGLRWSDYDGSSLHVRRAIGEGEDGPYVKDPKTRESKRSVPLTAMLKHVLQEKYDVLRINRDFYGSLVTDPYILGTQEPDSKPYNPSRLTKDFKVFRDLHGFNCTFHDLRHTFATMMIAEGVDIRTVSSYLGHASVSMTLNIYASVDPEAKLSAVSRIESALHGSRFKGIQSDSIETMNELELQELICRANDMLIKRASA